MRLIALLAALSCGLWAIAAQAQVPYTETHSRDAAISYQWVRSNAPPGGCGCFSLNGIGISASRAILPSVAAVAEFSGEYAGSGPYSGNTLTLVSYMAGGRYWFPQSWQHGPHALQPFAQVMLGAAHAGGGLAGAGDAAYALAARGGGGVDLPLSYRLAARGQVDYYLTKFPNTANDHQNNLLIGAGLVYRWGN
ncbi:MAG: hypothetical protein NVSMB3_01630 [Acidobacteriaceae bacterium]